MLSEQGKQGMKLIIAGSRACTEFSAVCAAVEQSGFTPTTIISGRAPGVDQLGERWARERNIPILYYPANWWVYGAAAGYIRNREMAEVGDALVAVWDGESRGTQHMIRTMEDANKPVFVFKYRL